MTDHYQWNPIQDVTLTLELREPNLGTGLTGKSPEVAIRRHRDLAGNLLDDFYWDGAAFVVGPVFLPLGEFDAANNPGLYLYHFAQSDIALEQIYLVYFRHTAAPIGFDVEEHVFAETIESVKSDGSPFDPDGILP